MNLNEPLVIRVYNEWRKGCPNTWQFGPDHPRRAPWACQECTWGAIKAAARDLLWVVIGKPRPGL